MKPFKLTEYELQNCRGFISNSSVALAGFTIVPNLTVSGLGHIAPSDKLNIAGIGIGGKGSENLANAFKTQNIVALFDVDWSDRTGKVFKTYPDAKKYKDFRIMLDKQKDNEFLHYKYRQGWSL
jgi:hypothetical protein